MYNHIVITLPSSSCVQLTANIIIFIAVNIVGIYIHDRREHAQRKVFNNIRACVAGRMHMEDDNEKLVRGLDLAMC